MKKLDKVIYEINGKDTFVKVKNNSFEIEKTIFSYVKYDSATHKAISSGNFYLDFASCVSLFREIDKGILQRDVKMELERCKKENQKYPKAIRQFQGGIPEEKAGRADKKALARVMSIEPGTSNPQNYPYVLKYQEGAGKTNPENKLITPLWWSDKNIKPDMQIFVPCSESDMVKMGLLLYSHMNAFIASRYALGSYLSSYDANGKKQETTEYQEPRNQTKTTVKPVVGKNISAEPKPQNKEAYGDTSETRNMQVKFTTLPSYIEGTNGLYTCRVDVKGRNLELYFTGMSYSEHKERIKEAFSKEEIVSIQYVIVKDPNDSKNAYTYFMGITNK